MKNIHAYSFLSYYNINGIVTHCNYNTDVISQNDYFPACHENLGFGMLACPVHTGLPNRHESSNEYRYGFNGMEKDDEIHNVKGSSYDFGARIYDSRVGRWLSRDAHERNYPSLSPYNFVGNSPLIFIDPDGNDIKPVDSYSEQMLYNDFDSFYSTLKFRGSNNIKNPADFFGIVGKTSGDDYENYGKGSTKITGVVLTTSLSIKEFNKRVRKIKGYKNRKAAKSIFKMLHSEEIIQVRYLSDSPPKTLSNDVIPYPEPGNLQKLDKRRRTVSNDKLMSYDNKNAINSATNTQILNEPSLSLSGGNFISFKDYPIWVTDTQGNITEIVYDKGVVVSGTVNLKPNSSLIDAAIELNGKGVLKYGQEKEHKSKSEIKTDFEGGSGQR